MTTIFLIGSSIWAVVATLLAMLYYSEMVHYREWCQQEHKEALKWYRRYEETFFRYLRDTRAEITKRD